MTSTRQKQGAPPLSWAISLWRTGHGHLVPPPLALCRLDRHCRSHTSRVAALDSRAVGPVGAGPGWSEDSALKWRDRVALYAQFSPEQTLEALLSALQQNSREDDGIDALYTFANFDVWAISSSFFGGFKMDLGQFERFKRVMISQPYDVLLRHRRRRFLSGISIQENHYVARIEVESWKPHATRQKFQFRMSRVLLGNHRSWMVDQIVVEDPPEHP